MTFKLKKLTNEERVKYGMKPLTDEEMNVVKGLRIVDEENDMCFYGKAKDVDTSIYIYIVL